VVVGSDEGGGAPAITGAEGAPGGDGSGCECQSREEDDWAGPACPREGGGWLAGPVDRLRPSGGAGKAAQREGRGDGLGEGGGP
jgi:hypothetical protein